MSSRVPAAQHGAVLSKLVPNIAAGKNIGELFAVSRPAAPQTLSLRLA